MCDTRTRSKAIRTTQAPGWFGLYVVIALTALALAAVDIGLPGTGKRLVEFGLIVAGCGAMALWVQRNRVALDLEQWCDCAQAALTIREIHPADPEPATVDRRLQAVG